MPVGGVSEGWRSELRPFVFFAPNESKLHPPRGDRSGVSTYARFSQCAAHNTEDRQYRVAGKPGKAASPQLRACCHISQLAALESGRVPQLREARNPPSLEVRKFADLDTAGRPSEETGWFSVSGSVELANVVGQINVFPEFACPPTICKLSRRVLRLTVQCV